MRVFQLLLPILMATAFGGSQFVRFRRAAVANPQRLWPDGVIPYIINETFPGDLQRLFQVAMRHWENHTCISFVPKRPRDVDHIIFTTDKCGCCSYVGRRGDGQQIISIGKNCDKFGIIVHELGHVVGFSHEHTRPDRDSFVEIFHNNIQDGQDYNFDKSKMDEINSRGETYDFDSIMHYARDTFARTAFLDTILPKKPPSGERPKIGQRTKLSSGDIRQTNKMYNCPACLVNILDSKGEITISRNNTECSWRIIGAIGERILLKLTSLGLKQSKSRVCAKEYQNYMEISDGFSPGTGKLLGKMCGGVAEKTFLSSSNAVFIRLISNQVLQSSVLGKYTAVCGGSYYGSSGTIQSPNFPDQYLPEKLCYWNITVPKGYRVAINIQYFNLEAHQDCSYDRLEVFETHIHDDSNLIARLCGQKAPKFIATAKSNKMLIKFFSDTSIQKNGFHINYLKEVDECQTQRHNCQQICINKIGSFECDCFSGYSLNADGKTCESTCGGQLSPIPGNFFSPNYPGNYASNKKCVWEIKAPSNHHVVVNFTTFNIEGLKSDCEYDYVHLKPIKGLIASNELRLCGEYADPVVLLSQEKELRVTFHSDNSMERKGFAAHYYFDLNECAHNNGGCDQICVNIIGSYECRCEKGLSLADDGHSCTTGGCFVQSYEPAGEIHSPDFPSFYPTAKNCTWHLLTTPGHRINLTFGFFDVEDHYACRYDQVIIYDGGDHSTRILGSYCGRTPPKEVVSTGNQLLVELRSDDTQPRQGFNATYESVCGGRLKADSTIGFVYSHARYGDRKYIKMTKCTWELYTDAEQGVKLTFTQFDVERERGCEYDYVAVYDGLSKHADLLIGQFCGDDLPPTIVSSANGLLVEFTTDNNVEQKGFVFQYSASNALPQPNLRPSPTLLTTNRDREPILND